MKLGWVGQESAGKSQLLAVKAVEVLYRNLRWIKLREERGLDFVPRTMAFDSPMSPAFIKRVEEAGMKYIHFRSFDDILWSEETDVFIHEISRWFPARGSEPLTPDQIEFLSQASKVGVDIFFCCQDFSQVHKQFRFLVNDLYQVVKLIGSERPKRSAPPVKHIWGVVLYWELDPLTFKGETLTMEKISAWPEIYFINKEDTELYDTSYKVVGAFPPPIRMVEQEFIYLDRSLNEVKRDKKWVKR